MITNECIDAALKELSAVGKLEGDLNALIDLSLSQPMPEPGFIIVKSYKRRARRAAA